MKKRIAKILSVVFLLSFVLSPNLVHAAAQSTTWIFYPQKAQTGDGSVRSSAYEDEYSVRYRIYDGQICKYDNKALVLDINNDLLTTSDGENWETIGHIDDNYHNIFSNGKQIIAEGWRSNKVVSDDGKNWLPCNVQDSLYKKDGFDKFVTYPSWELEVSSDGENWTVVDLRNSSIGDDPDFLYKQRGNTYYADFIFLEKVNGLYYMITDEGASIVSSDLINWTKNSGKIKNLDYYSEFKSSGDYIFCYADDTLVSKDAKNWQKIDASWDVQWDGTQFIDLGYNQDKNTVIKVSTDGLNWKVIKELVYDDYELHLHEIIDSDNGEAIVSGISYDHYDRYYSNRLYQIKGDQCIDLGEFNNYGYYNPPTVMSLPDKRIIIFNDLSTLVEYNNANVKINSNDLVSDQPSIIYNGRTLVPLRAIFEALGATVEWDGATNTVTGTKGNTKISLQIGNKTAVLNGNPVALDVPAKMVNDRTMVPARFISESLGCKVNWDDSTNTVNIATDGH